MNILDLKFGSVKEMLTKDQMKQISGGKAAESLCIISINSDCGGGVDAVDCGGSTDYCQGYEDAKCEESDCCDGVEC